MTYGDKYSEKEVNHFFELAPIEENKINCSLVCDMILGKTEDEVPPAAPGAEEPEE
jgi:hypothetical protein